MRESMISGILWKSLSWLKSVTMIDKRLFYNRRHSKVESNQFSLTKARWTIFFSSNNKRWIRKQSRWTSPSKCRKSMIKWSKTIYVSEMDLKSLILNIKICRKQLIRLGLLKKLWITLTRSRTLWKNKCPNENLLRHFREGLRDKYSWSALKALKTTLLKFAQLNLATQRLMGDLRQLWN